jgi:hypothetical protein
MSWKLIAFYPFGCNSNILSIRFPSSFNIHIQVFKVANLSEIFTWYYSLPYTLFRFLKLILSISNFCIVCLLTAHLSHSLLPSKYGNLSIPFERMDTKCNWTLFPSHKNIIDLIVYFCIRRCSSKFINITNQELNTLETWKRKVLLLLLHYHY